MWKTEIAVSFCILYWSLQIRFYGSPSEFKMMLKTKKKPRRSHNRVYHRFGEILCNFFSFTSIHGANHIADDFQRFNKPSTRARFSKRYSNWKFFLMIYWNQSFMNLLLKFHCKKWQHNSFGQMFECDLLGWYNIELLFLGNSYDHIDLGAFAK